MRLPAWVLRFDRRITDRFGLAGRSVAADRLALVLTQVGTTPTNVLVCGLIALWRPAVGLAIFIAFVASELLNLVLKRIFKRKRPDRTRKAGRLEVNSGLSFPSCHAQQTTVIYGSLALAAGSPLLAVPLVLLCVAVWWSRVHMREHFASDIVVGALVGGVIALVTNFIILPEIMGPA